MHTYNEWLLLGYQVQRGQRSRSRNKAGIPTFAYSQVKRISRRSAYTTSEDYNWLDEFECFDIDNDGWGTG